MNQIESILLILKVVFFIIIFTQVYYLLIKLRGRINRDIQEAKNISSSRKWIIGRFFDYLDSQYNNLAIYNRINDYLLKAGNPLNLTPTSYIFLKIVLSIAIPFYAYINYKNFEMTFLGFLTGLFVLDVIILIEKQNRKQQILNDLPDIIDSLKIQVSSGVPLTAAIQELYKIPKNKNFSKLLEHMTARYSLTKDMTLAVEEFRKHFDMVEIEGLCLTLEQNEATGSSLALLENQSQILHANHIFKIQRDTKKKEYLVIICMILILINIASVILYPIVSQINQSLKSIFS